MKKVRNKNVVTRTKNLSLDEGCHRENQEFVTAEELIYLAQEGMTVDLTLREILHGSENFPEIDLKTFLSKYTSFIFKTYSIDPNKVTLNIDIENIPISINQATPLGLIINELISNSLKYAFPDEKKGEINISMKKQDKEIVLIVKDNGVGIPDGLEWENSATLGLQLVQIYAKYQNHLDGSIDLYNTNGTKFIIKFNLDA
jgi:two-component system, sensor histidine kinase PdtaS